MVKLSMCRYLFFHCYTPGRSVAVIFSACGGAAHPERLIPRKGSSSGKAAQLPAPTSFAPPLTPLLLPARLSPPPSSAGGFHPREARWCPAAPPPFRSLHQPLAAAFLPFRLRPSPARSSLVPRGSAAFPKPSSAPRGSLHQPPPPRPSPARSSLVPGGSAAPCSGDYQRNDKEFFRICYIT